MAETKFEVESFISSPVSKQNPEFSTHATNALLHFEMANSIWSIKFSSRQVNNDLALTDELLRRYPAAAQYLRKMGSFDLIEYSKMLPIIWNAASQEIAQASDTMTPSPK